MDHGHAALIGKLPEIFRTAPDPDLDHALGIEHTIENRLPERPAMMKLRALIRPRRVAMRIDMHHPDRL